MVVQYLQHRALMQFLFLSLAWVHCSLLEGLRVLGNTLFMSTFSSYLALPQAPLPFVTCEIKSTHNVTHLFAFFEQSEFSYHFVLFLRGSKISTIKTHAGIPNNNQSWKTQPTTSETAQHREQSRDKGCTSKKLRPQISNPRKH